MKYFLQDYGGHGENITSFSSTAAISDGIRVC